MGNLGLIATRYLSLLLCLFATSTARAACFQSPPGLVSWWNGEGNAADSAGTNHGSLMNGASYALGKVGMAFSFDGIDDRIEVPSSESLAVPTNSGVSVEAWIRAYPSTSISSIAGKRRYIGGGNERGYELFLADGRLAVQFATAESGYRNFVSSSSNLLDGVDHHVGVTMSPGSASGGKLYLDGQVILTFDTSALLGDLTTTEPVRIGCHPDPIWRFKGLIDEVGIYHRV
jgi:hypothetical protein